MGEVRRYPVAPAIAQPQVSRHSLAHRRVADIQQESIRWLWPGRIARGKVSMIAGHPGLGKSQLTASLAATVTTGGRWPVDRTQAPTGRAVILSAEDDPADTIAPRLAAAGADLERVHVVDAVTEVDRDGRLVRRTPDLVRDLDHLDGLLDELGDVVLFVVDPVTAYLGGIDSHRTSDVRGALAPLSEMAARRGAAVVCVSHLNKGGPSSEAMMRVTGSLAFVAAARAAYVVCRDPEDEHRRLVLPAKNNLGDDRYGLAYRIEPTTVAEGIATSRVAWDAEPVTVTADEALAPERPGPEPNDRREAADWLRMLLADGPVLVKELRQQARDAGLSWGTVRRAKEEVGVQARKQAFAKGWVWQLPEGAQPFPTAKNLRTFVETCAPSEESGSYERVSATEIGRSDERAQVAQVSGNVPRRERLGDGSLEEGEL